MKILILGASTTLGQKLIEYFSPKNKTIGTFFSSSINTYTYKNIAHLDLERHQVTEKFILDFMPDVVIFLSQFKAKNGDDERLKKELNINYEALKNVASICATLGKKIIYLSTDHVFSNDSTDVKNELSAIAPSNTFSKSKALSEEFLKEHIPNHIILRTPYIYGYSLNLKKRDFFGQILNAIASKEPMEIDNIVKRKFVLSDDVAKIIEYLLEVDEKGIFHIAPKNTCTSFEFANKVALQFGIKDQIFIPLNSQNDTLVSQPIIESKNLNNLPQIHNPVEVDEGIRIFKGQYGCLFRMIYSVRPDMLVANQNASDFRIAAGKQLAIEAPLSNVDHIIPIPESGIYSATGLSAESKVPLFFGIIRDYFTEKTLYSSTTANRYEKIKRKLIPVVSLVKDKNIVLVDEAVLSGSTLKVIVQILKDIGANDIHIRIPSPIISKKCTARVLPDVNLLYPQISPDSNISKKEYEEILCKEFGVESFSFLSLEGFLKIVNTKKQFCTDCFYSADL